METKNQRPWLTSTGVEIPTDQLKEISKAWDQKTWDDYLEWYEGPRHEALLTPRIYDMKCEKVTESVFQEMDHDSSLKNRRVCEELLSTLPENEAQVLRLKFFEGRTDREIAATRGISKSSVHHIKDRAILRLRRGHQGDILGTRRFMRGESSESSANRPSFWNQGIFGQLREAKIYQPTEQTKEFENIKKSSVGAAIRELSDRQRRIIYLRFWCDYSMSEIARDLKCGTNFIEQICEVAVSKLNRKIIQFETGYQPGGGPSCA